MHYRDQRRFCLSLPDHHNGQEPLVVPLPLAKFSSHVLGSGRILGNYCSGSVYGFFFKKKERKEVFMASPSRGGVPEQEQSHPKRRTAAATAAALHPPGRLVSRDPRAPPHGKGAAVRPAGSRSDGNTGTRRVGVARRILCVPAAAMCCVTDSLCATATRIRRYSFSTLFSASARCLVAGHHLITVPTNSLVDR